MTRKENVKILVVDDQPGMRETFADILSDKGFLVDVAEDGFHAIDKAKANAYDIIFMDIRMPGINGVQTYREIKKLKSKAAVIMMTAYAVEELIKEAIKEGAYSVLRKPFEREQIISLIERVLKQPKILVVDSKPENREILKDLLEGRSYQVTTAKTGTKAIDLVKGENFDIIFLDTQLPDGHGIKTLQEVQKIRPEIPVVVTGYKMGEEIRQAIEKGAYTSLLKPIDSECLIKVLDDVWEKKHLQKKPP